MILFKSSNIILVDKELGNGNSFERAERGKREGMKNEGKGENIPDGDEFKGKMVVEARFREFFC